MSTKDQQNNPPPSPQRPADEQIDPGHVMTRQHYEELARQSAIQK